MPVRGFTLLELLIVLGIAALTVTVVGVRADAWMEQSAYHQSIRDVATLLRAGKAAAWQEGRDIPVHFDDGARVLAIGDGGRQRVQLSPALEILVQRPPAVSSSPSRARHDVPLFVFRADGSAYGGRLELRRGSSGVAFQINWALGAIEQVMLSGNAS